MKEGMQNRTVRWTESSRNTSDIEHVRKNSRRMLGHEIEAEITKSPIYERLIGRIPILRNYLDSSILEKILHEKQTKIIDFLNESGVDTSNIHWLEVNRIIFKEDMSCKGVWNPVRESISLRGTRKNIGKEIGHTLTHELLHSVSRNSNYESVKGGGEINTLSGKSGIATTINQFKRKEDSEQVAAKDIRNLNLFNALNEAITELITMHIEQIHYGSYAKEVRLLEQIIKSIAIGKLSPTENGQEMRKRLQKTEREVFNMFVKTYIQGWSKELKKEILENFGENALLLLSKLDAGDLRDGSTRKNLTKYFSCNRHVLKARKEE